MTSRSELEQRLKQINAEIDEIQKRIPTHSAKPPIMMALFDLEDERQAILSQLTYFSESS